MDLSADSFYKIRRIITYSLENTYPSPKDELDSVIRQDFFKDIYFDRPQQESSIRAWIESESPDLGRIIGVQGSGKSTVLRKVEHLLDSKIFPFLSINFQTFFEQELEKEPDSLWKTFIDDYLKGLLTEKFFVEERIYKFFKYFLYEDTPIQRSFHDERDAVHSIFIKSERKEKEADWFNSMLHSSAMVSIKNKIKNKLSLEHYLLAAMMEQDRSIKRFIIVFDNVDRVPRKFQCRLYEIADDLRTTHKSICSVIIASRKETCHPPEICNVNASPIAEFGIYEGGEGGKSKLSQDDFFGIVRKRIKYINEHRLVNGEDIVLFETVSSACEEMYKASRETPLINLANQSLRDALRYHCSFIEFLLSEFLYEELKEIIHKPGHNTFLLSCLYGWITQYREILDKQCVNVVHLLDKCKTKEFKNIRGCDLSYLILVCLHNFKTRNLKNPSGTEVLDLFKPLSVKKEEFLIELFKLWELHNYEFGKIINIYQDPLPNHWRDISMDADLEINFRAETLIKQVAISFTFISKLLYDMDDNYFYPVQQKKKIKRYYDLANISQHFDYNVQFLYRLGFLHLLELHKIRTCYNHINWLSRYTSTFCIDKKLQLTRIISRNRRYISNYLDDRVSLSTSIRESLIKNLGVLNLLDELYLKQVESFTPDNISDTNIINFPLIHSNISEYNRLPAIEDILSNSANYRNIRNLL